MFKLIKSARGLRTLFNTLITSTPAIANVGALLLLLMYVYGILGLNLFGAPGNVYEAEGREQVRPAGATPEDARTQNGGMRACLLCPLLAPPPAPPPICTHTHAPPPSPSSASLWWVSLA